MALDMAHYAKKGAASRLTELDAERETIFRHFPDLRPARVSKTGRTMSTAARRRMAAGMRRYWAKRKAEGK